MSSPCPVTPRTSGNPKVQYRIYNRRQPIPVLSQINPIHASPSLLKIHFKTVLLPTSRSSNVSPSELNGKIIMNRGAFSPIAVLPLMVSCIRVFKSARPFPRCSILFHVPAVICVLRKKTSKFLDLRPTTPKHEMFYYFKSHLSM